MKTFSGKNMNKIYVLLFIGVSLFANNLTKAEQEEAKQGKKYFDKILKKVKLSNDTKTLTRLKKVGLKLAKASKKDYDWEFALVEDKRINAFCLPGGKVVFYTGIFKAIDNDEQIAAVMSHEVAHVLLRHGGMKGKAHAILSVPKRVGKELFGQFIPKDYHDIIEKTYDTGKDITLMMPYGRHQESEADRDGVRLMKKAGYNPREAIKFWQNMKKYSKGNSPEFLSTHPSHDNRIKVIKNEIGKL